MIGIEETLISMSDCQLRVPLRKNIIQWRCFSLIVQMASQMRATLPMLQTLVSSVPFSWVMLCHSHPVKVLQTLLRRYWQWVEMLLKGILSSNACTASVNSWRNCTYATFYPHHQHLRTAASICLTLFFELTFSTSLIWLWWIFTSFNFLFSNAPQTRERHWSVWRGGSPEAA